MNVNARADDPPGSGREQTRVADRFRALRKALYPSQQAFANASGGHLTRTQVVLAEGGGTLARTEKWFDGVAAAAGVEYELASRYLSGALSLEELLDRRRQRQRPSLPSPVDDATPSAVRAGIEAARLVFSADPLLDAAIEHFGHHHKGAEQLTAKAVLDAIGESLTGLRFQARHPTAALARETKAAEDTSRLVDDLDLPVKGPGGTHARPGRSRGKR